MRIWNCLWNYKYNKYKRINNERKKNGIVIWLYSNILDEFINWIIQCVVYGMKKYKDNKEVINELQKILYICRKPI